MTRWTFLLFAAAWLGLVGSARAVYPPAIKDDGKFFKPDTLEKANKKIREIYQNYKKDVVIETLPALSADQEKKLKDEGKEKFFAKLAVDRAKELGVNGLYIVFCKKPPHLQVEMDPQTRKQGFTNADRKKLIEKFIARFREEKFDEGLLEGLDFIETTLKSNRK
jgi:hypothetical protein